MARNKNPKNVIKADYTALKADAFKDENPLVVDQIKRQSIRKVDKLPAIDLNDYSKSDAEDMFTSIVEHHMITRNISSPHRLSKLLGISYNRVDKAIKRIHNRWATITPSQREQRRGRCLRTYEAILDKAFSMADDDSLETQHKLSALRLAGDMNKQISELMGVKQVEGTTVNNTAILIGDTKRDNIKMIAERFNQILSTTPHDIAGTSLDSEMLPRKLTENVLENSDLPKIDQQKRAKPRTRVRKK